MRPPFALWGLDILEDGQPVRRRFTASRNNAGLFLYAPFQRILRQELFQSSQLLDVHLGPLDLLGFAAGNGFSQCLQKGGVFCTRMDQVVFQGFELLAVNPGACGQNQAGPLGRLMQGSELFALFVVQGPLIIRFG